MFSHLSIWLFFLIYSSNSIQNLNNPCKGKKFCGECFITHPECGWCQQAKYDDEGSSRCDFVANLIQQGCAFKNIVDPSNYYFEKLSLPLSKRGATHDFVQIAPQKVSLKLRPKKSLKFKVHFRQAEDYPVDLYYLMDLSNSMGDDKEKLAALGDLIGSSMRKITSNFRLGFGSFVDKVVMPFVDTVGDKLEHPCEECAAPYGFKNHLSLTSDTSLFAKMVKDTPISGNLDAPEGGLDALMQSIVCTRQIQWRPEARKLIIYSSDASFHFAGDGLLGGIVVPNDGACHLSPSGLYTHSTLQDYPSVGHIIHTINHHSINMIFAITGSQLDVYEKLALMIEGSTVGQLANDSSNIVELVKENYNKITSKVELKDNAPANISIVYESACLGNTSSETKICKGLKFGDTVTFDVTISADTCIPGNKIPFRINPVGISEQLEITLNVLCECDCEKPPYVEYASDRCNGGSGTFACGVCKCDSKSTGRNCECNISDHNSSASIDSQENCKAPGDDEVLCSGRGDCNCGVCDCWARNTNIHERFLGKNSEEVVSGPQCQCDNFSCDRFNNKVCGGSSHGTCECGTCVCNEKWTGDACQCLKSNSTCIASNGKLCNGVGKCECGACTCDVNSRYRGPTCEDCPTCPGLCAANKACVQCILSSNDVDEESIKKKCSAVCSANIQNFIVLPTFEKSESEKTCSFKNDDGCTNIFSYGYDEERNLKLKIQKEKVCPSKPNLLAIILPIVSGIIMAGLIMLLMWKLLTWLHDRREFARFEKARQLARWDTGENPIFKRAISTYTNPTYKGKHQLL